MGMHAPPYTYMDMAVTPGYIYPVRWGNVMQSLTYGQVALDYGLSRPSGLARTQRTQKRTNAVQNILSPHAFGWWRQIFFDPFF